MWHPLLLLSKATKQAHWHCGVPKCFRRYILWRIPERACFLLPEIEIIGVASGVGQAKMAAERLEQWQAAGYIGASTDDSTGTDTAVVLADETLLMPVLSHLPDSIATTNVTMGFPMKLTPVAAVMRSAVALQRRVRMVDGRPAFSMRMLWEYWLSR